MGHDEQAGIKAAVDWLGTQSWSNGKVGAIGKSYDGSTPWNAQCIRIRLSSYHCPNVWIDRCT